MAWAHVATGTMAATSAVDPSINPGAPTGSSGVLFLSIWASGVTPNLPSEWTEVVSQTRTRLAWRIATGGADDTPTVTATGTSGLAAQIARFSGGPTTVTGGVDASAGNGAPTSADIPTAAITTPAGDGRLIIYTGAVVAGSTHLPFNTFPNSSTAIDSAFHDFSTDFTVAWSYAIQATAAAVGASSFDQSTSANTGTARAVTASFIAGTGGSKFLKVLTHSAAQSKTGVQGAVFEAPSGGNLTGDKIGEFTAQAFEATLEGGEAVLLVDVADFGGSALTTASTPRVEVRYDDAGTIKGTAIVPATVIEV